MIELHEAMHGVKTNGSICFQDLLGGEDERMYNVLSTLHRDIEPGGVSPDVQIGCAGQDNSKKKKNEENYASL